MVQSVPDAAKPHTLPSEVEARFRDSSRSMHGFQWRSAKTQARALYAPELLDGHRFYGNAAGGGSPQHGTNQRHNHGRFRHLAGVAQRRNHMHTWLAHLRRLSSIRNSAKLLSAAFT